MQQLNPEQELKLLVQVCDGLNPAMNTILNHKLRFRCNKGCSRASHFNRTTGNMLCQKCITSQEGQLKNLRQSSTAISSLCDFSAYESDVNHSLKLINDLYDSLKTKLQQRHRESIYAFYQSARAVFGKMNKEIQEIKELKQRALGLFDVDLLQTKALVGEISYKCNKLRKNSFKFDQTKADNIEQAFQKISKKFGEFPLQIHNDILKIQFFTGKQNLQASLLQSTNQYNFLQMVETKLGTIYGAVDSKAGALVIGGWNYIAKISHILRNQQPKAVSPSKLSRQKSKSKSLSKNFPQVKPANKVQVITKDCSAFGMCQDLSEGSILFADNKAMGFRCLNIIGQAFSDMGKKGIFSGVCQGMFRANQKLTYYSLSDNNCVVQLADFTSKQIVAGQGGKGKREDQLEYPTAVIRFNQVVVISDSGNNRLLASRKTKEGWKSKLCLTSCEGVNLNFPWGLCSVGAAIFLADQGNNRIIRFSLDKSDRAIQVNSLNFRGMKKELVKPTSLTSWQRGLVIGTYSGQLLKVQAMQ